MKVSKFNIAIFFISAFLFSLFFFISCSKTLDGNVEEIVQANAFGKNDLSEMSLEEKNAYCEFFLESKEYHMLQTKISWFTPISLPALKDEALYRTNTKAELMAWIGKNLTHTKFKSVADAEKMYDEIENLKKIIQQKFAAFNFGIGCSNISFLAEYRENKVNAKRLLSKSNNCEAQAEVCANEADARANLEKGRCFDAYVNNSISFGQFNNCVNHATRMRLCDYEDCHRFYMDCIGNNK